MIYRSYMIPSLPQASVRAKSEMYSRGIAVVAITRRGVETALKIKEALDKAGLSSKVYAPEKFRQSSVFPLDGKIADFVKESYSSIDALVGVMAAGIIIRSVAPFLESKLTDPAVIAVDASGKFVISLLSGHFGGANDLTRTIAQGIGGKAVITTASDATGKQSVDELARNLHLNIENPRSLIAVNSAIVNDERLVVVLVGDVEVSLDQLGCYEVKRAKTASEALDIVNNYDAGVLVTSGQMPSNVVQIDEATKPFTILKTKRIVVGLGARKDSSVQSILEAIDVALEKTHVPLASINSFATVDIKRDSPAMIKAAVQLKKTLEFLSVDELRSVSYSGLSPDSKLVQDKIGVGGVCERAAIFAAGKKPELILKKTKLNGVTVAVALGE